MTESDHHYQIAFKILWAREIINMATGLATMLAPTDEADRLLVFDITNSACVN